MSTRTHLLLVGLALLLTAGGVWYAVRTAQARDENARVLVSLEKARNGLDAKVKNAERRREAAESSRQMAQAELEAARTATARKPGAPSETSARSQGGGSTPSADLRKLIVSNPKMENLFVATVRDRVRWEYGLLFSRHKLSPAQIEKFVDSATKLQELEMDLYAVGEADSGSRESVRELSRKAQEEHTAVMRELLGEEAATIVRDYNRMGSARNAVGEIGGAAAMAGVPLSATQAQQLYDILSNASSTYQKGGFADLRSIDWTAADAQAAKILSPAQLAVYHGGSRGRVEIQTAIEKALESEGLTARAAGP